VSGKSGRGAAPSKGKSKLKSHIAPKGGPKRAVLTAKKPMAKNAVRPSSKSTVKSPLASRTSGQSLLKTKLKGEIKVEPASVARKAPIVVSRPSAPPVAEKRSPAPMVAAAPPANGKPGKNPAGFSTRELDSLRDLLLAKRRELIGDMSSMESEALRSGGGSNLSNLPIHMADMGTDNYEQEFTLGLVQKERDLLKEINSALAKIKNGTYGLCEGTGQPIIKERLEYQPWARYSVEYQRKMERHGR
jgi:RNA polymerase-binding transcription factor DksA